MITFWGVILSKIKGEEICDNLISTSGPGKAKDEHADLVTKMPWIEGIEMIQIS